MGNGDTEIRKTTRFEQSLQELRHAYANVKRYSGGFSDADVAAHLDALETSGPNDEGKEPA